MGTKSEENVSLVRRFLTDVVADGDLDALDALVADTATDHEPTVGPDEIEPLVRGVLSAADVDVEVGRIVASNDWVAVRAIISGTIAGLPSDDVAAGRSFEVPHASRRDGSQTPGRSTTGSGSPRNSGCSPALLVRVTSGLNS